jgi:hypothetical protein
LSPSRYHEHVPVPVIEAIEEQRASNRSGMAYFGDFENHRRHLTALAIGVTPEGSSERLCVLGAGNTNDLDLEALLRHFAEVHLVDLDRAALERAMERVPAELRPRCVLHAPVDLGGLLEKLERWAAMRVTPDELIQHPGAVSRAVNQAIGGPFSVVLSACLLSQLQFSALQVLGDKHPLFEAVRLTTSITHLRVLNRLIAAGGRGIFAADLTSNQTYPLDRLPTEADLRAVYDEVLKTKNVIYVSHPELLKSFAREDPVLKKELVLSDPLDVWLWNNGPSRVFLVYALELTHPSGPATP